jgi:hypothetical protein
MLDTEMILVPILYHYMNTVTAQLRYKIHFKMIIHAKISVRLQPTAELESRTSLSLLMADTITFLYCISIIT